MSLRLEGVYEGSIKMTRKVFELVVNGTLLLKEEGEEVIII